MITKEIMEEVAEDLKQLAIENTNKINKAFGKKKEDYYSVNLSIAFSVKANGILEPRTGISYTTEKIKYSRKVALKQMKLDLQGDEK